MEKFRVTFYPDNKSIEVEKDRTILSAAISAGVYINSACGGDGVCGRCKVRLRKGEAVSHASAALSEAERAAGTYLACLTRVHSDLEVEIPADSRLNLEFPPDYSLPEDIDTVPPASAEDFFVHSPLATKLYLELPAPTLDDKISDAERLCREVSRVSGRADITIGFASLKALGELLRSSDWKVTVTLAKRGEAVEVVSVEPQDTSSRNFGFCFDIGTTTVSAQLVDLNTKQVLGTKATYNKQAAFGSDVITRIIYAKEKDGLAELHRAVTDDMNEMILELTREHAVDLNDVTCVVCSGNTTMMHLLLRVDPTYIRREPYVPVFNFAPVIRASEAEIHINPRGLLGCVPGVASYVGGDVTAGVLASGLYQEKEPCILIDIGTNGEIVVGNKEFLIAAAASAGPAFEGSGVSCGMRATRGAIQKIEFSAGSLEPSFGVIGGGVPAGICGSAYIDLIAGLLRGGALDKDGRIRAIPHARIRSGEAGREFVLVDKVRSATGREIVVTDADIENLKRAKAAIYSATSVLVRHVGLDFSRIGKVFIAGGFGTYLNTENAVAIGLLPDLERKKFFFIGNSSLSGSRQILLSAQAMELADRIAKKTAYLELSVEPRYMEEYMAALFFPHTDLNLFPSVRS